MTPKRKQRIALILLLITGLSVAVGLTLYALKQNINLFYSPSQINQGEAPVNHSFRIGGLVKKNSVTRSDKKLMVSFVLTDKLNDVLVQYRGILPDLFREEQGIVATGKLNQQGVFIANEVLAKHDENYMPPAVKAALDKAEKRLQQQALRAQS